ncbi:hypothetical protein EJB05_37871, partial [Eragrostis curvula]
MGMVHSPWLLRATVTCMCQRSIAASRAHGEAAQRGPPPWSRDAPGTHRGTIKRPSRTASSTRSCAIGLQGRDGRLIISRTAASSVLSALPDCLLHEVMSHMKARQVVQTCMLSARWQHLWRSVPCLDVDQEEFKTRSAGVAGGKEARQKFEDFGVILLGSHVSVAHLDTFRLSTTGSDDLFGENRLASSWIRRSIKFGTQKPWRLKRLHLSNVDLDDFFAEHLRSGCPSLEDLELSCCTCDFGAITSDSLKNLGLKCCRCKELSEITSPTLKNLVMHSGAHNKDRPLVIVAPDLACLFLSVITSNGIFLNEMASLARATIHQRWNEEATQSKIKDAQLKILSSVRNVTSLVLSSFKTMVFGEESDTFPEFKNMKTLKLRDCDISHDHQISRHILWNSPNLENLFLRHCKFTDDSKKKKQTSKPKKNPPSKCNNLLDVRCENLKQTEITYRDDDIRQLELWLHVSGNFPNNTIKLTKFALLDVHSCWPIRRVEDTFADTAPKPWFTDKSKKRASNSKKNPPPQCHNLMDIRCENLKHTEFVYRADDIRGLVELLLHISGNSPNTNIKLTRVNQ